MTKRPVRLSVEYGQAISELLADLDGGPQLPLLEGEAVGHRRLTPTEKLAVDELHWQIERAIGIHRRPS